MSEIFGEGIGRDLSIEGAMVVAVRRIAIATLLHGGKSDAFFAICELRVELVKRLPSCANAPWGALDPSEIASFAAAGLCAPMAPSGLDP